MKIETKKGHKEKEHKEITGWEVEVEAYLDLLSGHPLDFDIPCRH
jgi:hypothetical protein